MTGAWTNHLWQSTVFSLTAALTTLAFRRNRAQVRYWLWFSGSVKFLLPFALLTGLGQYVPPARQVPAQIRIHAAPIAIQIAAPFSETMPPAAPSEDPRAWLRVALLSAWGCGFAAIAWLRFRGWRRIRQAVRSSRPIELPSSVAVRSAPGLLEPGVVGVFRPILLLPAGITERLTPRRLEAVLAHELCHVQRRDNLTAAIHMVVEAVFWFHPLVWWIGARLVEERERGCDEAVLSLGNEPREYAEGILEVCKFYLESPLACVSGVTGSDLKKRVQAILAQRVGRELSLARKASLAIAATAALVVPLVVGMMNAPLMRGQSAGSAGPRFEVASVRPCASSGSGEQKGGTKKGFPGGRPIVSPSRLNTGCAALAAPYPMAGLIQRAYGGLGLGHVVALGSALPIVGGPSWIYTSYYVINATAPGNTDAAAMEGPMLLALLEDRFRLKVHRETREVPVYALTVAKGGPKLERAADGSCTRPDYSIRPLQPLPPGKRYCRDVVGGRKGPNTLLNLDEATVDTFGKMLGLVMDRPVIDRTGLSGKYNFNLEFAVDQSTSGALPGIAPAAADEPAAPSVFTVVQQQLGLKLEPTKGPREFLVIDHVERPSEN